MRTPAVASQASKRASVPGARLVPKARGPGQQEIAPRRKTAPARAPMARMPAAKKPAAVPQAAALAPLPTAAGLAAAQNALEALRTAPAGESKEAPALRGLWEQAEKVEEAGLGEGMELRRLAAGKAKELGLTAGEPRGGRSDGVLLVAWLEGEQVWLLQGISCQEDVHAVMRCGAGCAAICWCAGVHDAPS